MTKKPYEDRDRKEKRSSIFDQTQTGVRYNIPPAPEANPSGVPARLDDITTSGSQPSSVALPVASAPQSTPVGRLVPGKPGMMVSPTNPGGMIDINGFSSGEEVMDPYTNKKIRIP